MKVRCHGWIFPQGRFMSWRCPQSCWGQSLRVCRRVRFVSEATEDRRELVENRGRSITALGRAAFDSQNAEMRLKSLFSVVLESFGSFERAKYRQWVR